MIARKPKKIIYNILILCFLIGGTTLCLFPVHSFGKYRIYRQCTSETAYHTYQHPCTGLYQKICFEEYQQVRKGDTLVIIEDAEFRLRVAQAEADLANATAGR